MKLKKNIVYSLLIVLTIVSISIGFSATKIGAFISEIASYVRVVVDIRINEITISEQTPGTISVVEDYNVENVSSQLTLPNSDSYIIYNISIANLGNVDMGIFAITGLPENLKYEFIGYNEKDVICDDNNQCNTGITKVIGLKIMYKENGYDSQNTTYNLDLDFDFRQVFDIIYSFMRGTNLPTKIISGDTLDITFTDDATDVNINARNYTFDSDTKNLIVPNVTNSLFIEDKYEILMKQYPAVGATYTSTIFDKNNPLTIEYLGDGKFIMNGKKTSGKQFFIRLTNVLHGSALRTFGPGNLIEGPIQPVLTASVNDERKLNVMHISGSYTGVTQDNFFRVVLRGTNDTEANASLGYDFYNNRYYINSTGTAMLSTDVGMVSLYLRNTAVMTFTDFVFQIEMHEQTLTPGETIATAPNDPLTITIDDNNLVTINGAKNATEKYYIRAEPNASSFATIASHLYSSLYYNAPKYTSGTTICLEYVPYANLPDFTSFVDEQELSMGLRDTSIQSNMIETRISKNAGDDLTQRIVKKMTLTQDAGYRFIYLSTHSYAFNNYQFYLNTWEIPEDGTCE